MVSTNPDQIIDLFRLARIQQRRYNLEQFEASILRDIQATVNQARKQIVKDLQGPIREISRREHMVGVLQELDDLSLGLRQSLGQVLTTASAYVGSTGMQDAYETLSVNGLGSMVNNVALSPEQFRQFLAVNPIQGLLIPQWVDRAYTAGVRDQLQEEILTQLQIGALRGEGYAKIVRRLEDGFGQFSKRELTTLTRTFFQDSQVRAHQAVMEANRDVIEGWIWTVAADDRVCILCLPLSEQFYDMDEDHPPIPRHPNCRCMPRTKTVSYRSLGIDIDELEPIEQAVVTRGREVDGKWVIPPVGTGGAKVQGIQFFRGGIKEAFPNMPEKQQIAMIGPRRHGLLKAGKISLDDLVDKRTGRLVLLEDLRGGAVVAAADVINPKVLEWAEAKFGDKGLAKDFAEWFGDSKVVDSSGNPLPVYHGVKDAKVQIINKQVAFVPSWDEIKTTGTIEPGAWFAPDEKIASQYGTPVEHYIRGKKILRHEDPIREWPPGIDVVYRTRSSKTSIQDAWEIAIFDPLNARRLDQF